MSRVDEYILEFMYACDRGDALLSPKVIAQNINYTRNYVNKRLRKELVPRGLVVDEGNGLYRLSEDGMLAARGKMDPVDLENL